MTTELKPCPFCGIPPLFNTATGGISSVHCINVRCKLVVTVSKLGPDSKEKVYELWNARAE